MNIRKASIKDIDKLVYIEMSSFYNWAMNKKKFKSHLSRILALDGVNYFILEDKNKPIGYFLTTIKGKICYLNYFALVKRAQGKGLSNLLIRKVIFFANSKRCKAIELTVWAKNFRAIILYSKYNFQVIDIKRKYYSNGDDKLRMRRELR